MRIVIRGIIGLGLLLAALLLLGRDALGNLGETLSGTLGGLIVLLPIVGFFYACHRFFRWQAALQRRMRRDGLW